MDQTRLLNLPWWLWGLLSLMLAIVWIYIWPRDRALNASALRHWLLRWGHAATWFALSAGFFMRQWLPNAGTFANALALLGLGFYIAFMAALFRP